MPALNALRPRFFYGWWIVLAAGVATFVSSAFGGVLQSVVLRPMTNESGPTTASGAPATGTSTDATIVAAAQRGAIERYAGPVTPVGFLVGKAVRRAVVAGLPA